MIHDRLKEIRERSGRQSFSDDAEVTITYEDNNDQKALLELLDKIEPLYITVKEMKEAVHELQSMVHEHDNRHRVDDKISRIKAQGRELRTCFEEIRNKSERNTGVVHHVARTHHLSLVVHLSLVLEELSIMQADIHDRHAQYVRKELIITGQGGLDEAELENLLEETTEIFTHNLIQETQVARQQLSDLQERHNAYIKLEKSLMEVDALFKEVSVLVYAQGEKIDRIENNIFVAQAKTEHASKELASALQNQKKSRKMKFIIGIVVSVILLIILLVIIFSFI